MKNFPLALTFPALLLNTVFLVKMSCTNKLTMLPMQDFFLPAQTGLFLKVTELTNC